MIISTIIATYNPGPCIRRAIQSVGEQDYPNTQLIIIDGGFSDGTAEIVAEFGDAVGHWRSEPDDGISDAWNKGLTVAEGEWINFLGADDAYASPTVLSRFAEAARRIDPARTKVIYGRVTMVNALMQPTRRLGRPWDPVAFRTAGMVLPHQGTFQHASLFGEFGTFAADAGLAGDYELLLRHLRTAEPLFLPHLEVALMGDGGVSSDPSHYKEIFRAYREAQRRHGTAQWTSPAISSFLRHATLSGVHRIAPRALAVALMQWRLMKLDL